MFLCVIATNAQERTLQRGPTRVEIGPYQRGVAIYHHGLLISRNSSMVVTTPPWTPHYYLGPQPDAVAGAEEREIDGGVELVMKHRGQHDAFLGDDVVRVYDDGRVERELTGRFTKDEGEALIQWRIAALNPVLFIGRAYEAELRDGTRKQGVVSVAPLKGSAAETAYASDLSWIAFDSRIGRIRIEAAGDQPLICYDFRGGRWADPSKPLLWFGDLDSRIRKDAPVHYRVTFHFSKPQTTPPAQRPLLQGTARVQPADDAQSIDLDAPPTIIPRPKQAQFTDAHLRIAVDARRPIAVHVARDTATAAMAELARGFRADHEVDIKQVETPDAATIRFEALPGGLSPEGYTLQVDTDAVTIRAVDERGYLNAVQTLRQLIGPGPAGTILIRGTDIRDWPSLKFRGVHLFTGGQGPELHLRLLRRLLAPLKFNHLVLESEYIEWDCCPEIHHPEYGMPKDDVRQILAAARAVGIEVSPLVMSLGHCQWMFHNDQNLDLAEDPEAKWAYCVTNPDTYEFIYRVYQEAVDLFEPRLFHIGHDEFTERGRVPYRESSKPYTPDELLLMDTKRHHEWMAERGIRLMMWGDMLLGPAEGPDACHADSVEDARRIRAELPKDIIITDWHYADVPADRFNNLAVLHAAGFETIAATWYRPGNIVNFAEAAHSKDSLGLLQTTWAGYSLDPDSFAREKHQYAIYVLAAEAAWNAHNPIDPATFLHGEHFLRLMGDYALPPAQRSGWLADLSSISNEHLAAPDDAGWFGLGPQHDLSAVPRGTLRLGDVLFKVGDANRTDRPDVAVLYSKLVPGAEYPRRAELRVDQHADRLVFLHATNFACAPDAVVARYEVLRERGGQARIELRYGENIFAYDDLTAAPSAPIVWTGRTAAGSQVALRAFVWENPFPDQQIRAIFATSHNAAGGLMWLGLTGLHDAATTE